MFMCVFCLLAPVLFEESSIIAPNQQIHKYINININIYIYIYIYIIVEKKRYRGK